MFQSIGEMVVLLWRTVQAIPRLGRQRRKVCEQLFDIGNASLLMACILALFIGGVIALQTGPLLAQYGLATSIGGGVGVGMAKELAPVMMAILIAGRSLDARLFCRSATKPTSLRRPVLHKIPPHQLRAKIKHLGILRLHGHAQPMHVGISERLHAREVLDAPLAARAEQRLVDAKIMAVSMHQNDRAAEGDGLALQQFHQRTETGVHPVRAAKFGKWIGLDDNHQGARVLQLGEGE